MFFAQQIARMIVDDGAPFLRMVTELLERLF